MNIVDAQSLIQAGFGAWQRGDLDELEQMLDPAVTLKAINPGPWDCENRDQVMGLLRARTAGRAEQAATDVEVLDLDGSAFLVSGLGGGTGTATVVKIAAGRVISMQQISTETADPDVEAAVAAIRSGDTEALGKVLAKTPALTRGPVAGYRGRTLLHIATDWPGYWPNGARIVRALIENGADPDHRGGNNSEGETPLHWAASSDDVDVAAALLDGGADPEAPDGSIGTPLDNAIGYGCWHVAALLVARGVAIEKLWHAAALGRLDVLEAQLGAHPDQTEISQAFWHACAAAQRRAAELLLSAGADLNWTPDYADGTPLDAASGRSTRQENVIEWLEQQGATQARSAT